jgi:hypothetical protein
MPSQPIMKEKRNMIWAVYNLKIVMRIDLEGDPENIGHLYEKICSLSDYEEVIRILD